MNNINKKIWSVAVCPHIKYGLCMKMGIVHKNADYQRKCGLSAKMRTIHKNLDYPQKFELLTKIWIIDKILDCSQKCGLSAKMRSFPIFNVDCWNFQ